MLNASFTIPLWSNIQNYRTQCYGFIMSKNFEDSSSLSPEIQQFKFPKIGWWPTLDLDYTSANLDSPGIWVSQHHIFQVTLHWRGELSLLIRLHVDSFMQKHTFSTLACFPEVRQKILFSSLIAISHLIGRQFQEASTMHIPSFTARTWDLGY